MLKEYLKNLADVFRSALGDTEKINAQDFPDKVMEVHQKAYSEGYSAGGGIGYRDGYDIGLNEGIAQGKQEEQDWFWNTYQENGGRAWRYYYAFAGTGWNDETFKPKYNMIVQGSVANMFCYSGITDLVAKLNEFGVTLDITKATNVQGFAAYSSITRLPVLNFTGASDINGSFQNAKSLVYIEKIVVKETLKYSNAFTQTINLEDVTFEGVIGQSINFKDCTKLSKASITSVMTHLSTTSSGMTVTFSLTAVKKAFETSSGANDGNTSPEWLNLAASVQNWGINLS